MNKVQKISEVLRELIKKKFTGSFSIDFRRGGFSGYEVKEKKNL
ncbi:hypothetical protein ACFL6I_08405 [candidate division KSB1 bacterium]